MKDKAVFGETAEITAAHAAQPDAWRRACCWWQRILRFGKRPPRRLRLCETLPLGERRFVAVVEFEQSRFLLGGTPAALVLLARLGNERGGMVCQSTDQTTEMSAEAQ